jgi:mono/diheme cytochrome c family protein
VGLVVLLGVLAVARAQGPEARQGVATVRAQVAAAAPVRVAAGATGPGSTATPAAANAAPSSASSVEQGRGLFLARCGMCHLKGGTGTFMLGRRLGEANALLAERTNLDATYVKHVVRNGIVSMPRMTRAEVSDAELQAIVDYLTRTDRAQKESK